MNSRKLLQETLSSPANLRFGEVCALARAFGFHLSRVSGSHHIFARQDVRERVNLQDVERYDLPLGGELVATVSEFLTVGFSHTCIPNSKRLILTGSSRFCKEEPAVRKALTAATGYLVFRRVNAEPGGRSVG